MDKETYIEQEKLRLNKSFATTLFLAGIPVTLGLSVLDYYVTPENFKRFLIYRVVASIFFLASFFIVKYKESKIYQISTIIFATLAISAMVELMILDFGGHQSIYYVGMIIIFIFIFGFLPLFSIKITLLLAFIAYSSYVVPILIFDEITKVQIFVNNNIFLFASISVGVFLRYYNDRLLIEKLSLEYDLAEDKKKLEIYSLQLEDLVQDRTKELRKSEQWHRSIVDNANDGIIILDRSGIIVNINDKACEMHGFRREALIGTHLTLLEDRSRYGESADRMRRLLNGEALVYESMHHRQDGTVLYLEISSKAIIIAEEMFIQSFYRDITEKKRLQEHLFQSQKMESIGTLAGGIAHDFNNILTGIIGHSEIIRRSSLDEKGARSITVIEDAARRAGRMISKLLGFARKSNYELVPLSINDVIFDTVKLLERVIDKRINLTVELDNQLPFIHGDLNQMEQLVMNLIVNARDAMPKGGRIAIKTCFRKVTKGMPDIPPYVSAGDYVVLTVIDTGMGIPPDLLDKIFEPFFTTKERGKGTGLGLSMVYGSVKEHKGYIAVQSELNQGTLFTVYLPASGELKKLEKTDVRSVNGNEAILVVDDEQDILDAVQDALKSHGYTVFALSDPLAAIEVFKKIAPHVALVITDIVMPKLNGKELITRIKAINPNVKILAISGYTTYVAPQEEIGEISSFIQKPFESYYLLSVVRRVLDARPQELINN